MKRTAVGEDARRPDLLEARHHLVQRREIWLRDVDTFSASRSTIDASRRASLSRRCAGARRRSLTVGAPSCVDPNRLGRSTGAIIEYSSAYPRARVPRPRATARSRREERVRRKARGLLQVRVQLPHPLSGARPRERAATAGCQDGVSLDATVEPSASASAWLTLPLCRQWRPARPVPYDLQM